MSYTKRKTTLLFWLLFLCCGVGFQSSLIAQTISGKIMDNSKEPLIGATVLVKGATTGTVTDFNGNFSIDVDGGTALIISYTGYLTQEVAIGASRTLDIVMQTDAALLSEVVVTGYGSQKKENLTGAVGVVSAKALEARPITNASQSLQGQVSGVWVNQNSGEPGDDNASIRIRGIGTLNNADPLILVDGIEAPFGNIDPNDIETITVLKDAASAAIYGSRAANGVVLITTKRGKRNTKPVFNYTGYTGTSQSVVVPDYIWNSEEFMRLRNEADINSGRPALYPDNVVSQYASGPNTNWFEEVFRNAAIQQHNLSVSGGSDKTNFNISLGYFNQEGIIEFTKGTERYNMRLNMDTEITKRFTVGASMYVSRQVSDLDNISQDGGVLARATRLGPNFPAFDSQGRLADRDRTLDAIELSTPNILAEVQALNRVLADNRFLGNFYGEYEVIDGLKIRGTFAANYRTDDDKFFNRRFETFDWRTGELGLVWLENRRFENSYSERLNITSWLQATYEKNIQQHSIKVLGGVNQESFRINFFRAARLEIPSNSLPALSTGNPETATNTGGAEEWALRSFFGRVNYAFDDKYLFEFNVRRDGSSRFGANNRWANFPSFSAGWILSKENFLADSKIIDFLKLRISWGQLGNQNISGQDIGNYPFAANISFEPAYNFGGTIVGAAAQTTLGNPDIKWETTTQTDIGVNLAVFKKLSIEADYFIRTASDILFNQNNPAVTGVRQPTTVNIAKVENRGWELSTNYYDNIGKLNFSIGANVTKVESKVLHIDPLISGEADRIIEGAFIIQRGAPINALYGLEAVGIFKTQAEIDAAPDQSAFGQPTPGDLRYRDINGDGVITVDDRTVLGKDNPSWIYGINANLNIKGFDLAVIIQGVGDAQTFETARFYAPFANSGGVSTIWRDRWTPENPDASLPKIRIAQGGVNNNVNHSWWMTERGYFRLKNVQIGYTIPAKMLENNFLQSVRFFANGTNLLTFTNFIGFDPETVGQRNTNGTATYPQLKMFTAGANVKF